MKKLSIFVTLICALSGCFKEENYDTRLVLRPAVQLTSSDTFTPLGECVAYAFKADTAQWEIASWEDARNGVMRSRSDQNKTLEPFAVATDYQQEGLDEGTMLAMQLSHAKALIVVAHTSTENYAWTIYDVGINIPTTYIHVPFRFWKEGEFKQGKWLFFAPTIEVTDDDLTL